MSTYFMFGKYSSSGFGNMSKERTERIIQIVENFGGKVEKIFALLGEYDLVFIAHFPNMQMAMQVSIAMSKYSGITFTTSPAVPVEMFDELISNELFLDSNSTDE